MSFNNIMPRFLVEAMLREEAEASTRLDGETYCVGPVTVGDPPTERGNQDDEDEPRAHDPG